MQQTKPKYRLKHTQLLFQLIAITAGIITGSFEYPIIIDISVIIADVFVQILKWFSLPMIIFSILATTSNMEKRGEFFFLGKKIVSYTLLTTIIAATVGLIYFKLLNPTITNMESIPSRGISEHSHGIFGLLLVGGVLFSILFSFVLVNLPTSKRQKAHKIFHFFYKNIMSLIRYILIFMPIAIWAFVTLFVHDLNALAVKNLTLYLTSIVSANLTQAIIVLPILLFIKEVPIIKLFKGMLPALNLAFWSKSSGVALPLAIECAKKNLKIKDKVASFSLPLCTTINMNACAAFIITTVLFVATSNGMQFSTWQLISWIFIATIAAIGNAGVPMGCFTLVCALLSHLGVPLYLLGLILPFYTIIDMLESAINVWSDSCITAIVDSETI